MSPGKRRLVDWLSITALTIGIVVLCIGFVVRAQSQDATNARTEERINAVDRRVEKIESTLGYGMAALVANLLAHIFQIRTNIEVRRRKDGNQ